MNQEYSRYLETVIETIQDGLIVVDTAGVILSANPAMEKITGYNHEELVGQRCDILACDACVGARHVGKEHYCELFHQGRISRRRCRLRRRDGTYLPVLKNAALLKDDCGRVVGGVETITDLSEINAKEESLKRLHRQLSIDQSFQGIVGASKPMRQLFGLIEAAAESDAPVLIQGESGTGKEMVANAIHQLSRRAKDPWVKVNCAALNESLQESELFGHVKGAFTGAGTSRVGRFEAADGGDFLLDEIGELAPSTQVKLLRVLQEQVVERVGDNRPISIDVRLISATNRDLRRLAADGRFREDLYYRVAVILIQVPPLRERPGDLPLLIDAFTNRVRAKTGKPVAGFGPAAMEIMLGYDWPGNVRELINAIEYAFVLCREGEIQPDHLPKQLLHAKPSQNYLKVRKRRAAGPTPTDRDQIKQALKQAGGNRTEAAKLLGISRVTLWKWLKSMDQGDY